VAVLNGTTPHVLQATQVPVLEVLPPAERRRTGRVVRLALTVGLEAVSRAGDDPSALSSVFTSSSGDGQNCHELCEVLASSDRRVSPTRFHNSVHNAAAGYWSIATGAKAPSTALCAYDASFAAGLLEAMAQVLVDRTTVLLLAYDAPYPEPLHAKRPMVDAFGVALVLAPQKDASSLARLTAAFTDDPASRMSYAALETLRASIPAARSLPLLQQLALHEPGRMIIDYLGVQQLALEATPCV
jgi:hypothetical protein